MHLSVGLSVSESAKLCSYMHFRDAICLQEKSLLQKANLDKAIDFMDTLEEDIPKGQSERMNRNSPKQSQPNSKIKIFRIFDCNTSFD